MAKSIVIALVLVLISAILYLENDQNSKLEELSTNPQSSESSFLSDVMHTQETLEQSDHRVEQLETSQFEPEIAEALTESGNSSSANSSDLQDEIAELPSNFPESSVGVSNTSLWEEYLQDLETSQLNEYEAIVQNQYAPFIDNLGIDSTSKENILAELTESYALQREIVIDYYAGNLTKEEFEAKTAELAPSSIMMRYLDLNQLEEYLEFEIGRH